MRQLLKILKLQECLYTKKLANGLNIYVRPVDHIQQQLFWYGFYEKEAVLTWLTFIKADSIICDVGANIGFYSIMTSPKISQGRIYSFEPATIIRNHLLRNIERNAIENITVVPLCIGDKYESQTFYLSKEDNTGMSGLRRPENFSGQTETVQTITFDQWAEETGLQKIDLIKIDVEGAEMAALSGMKKVLQTFKPVIFIEVIDSQLKAYGRTISDVYNNLINLGYVPYEIIKANTLRVITTFKDEYSLVFIPACLELPLDISLE